MDYQVLIEMAVLAGEIMLVSGAEVYRIEDTVSRILKQSGLEGIEVFALATGIFATLSDPSISAITVVKRVNKRSTNLNRVYRVNNISRRFCAGEMTVEEAQEELKEIRTNIEYGFLHKCIGYIMTSTFFAVLFGGNWLDCVAAGVVGLVLALAVPGASRLRFNDFCQNAAGSFALAVTALLIQRLVFFSMNIDAVIISAIMPMVPGVTFTAAIRDTLNGDYSSGVARIAEAIVVALGVASGVGAAMVVFGMMGGGL